MPPMLGLWFPSRAHRLASAPPDALPRLEHAFSSSLLGCLCFTVSALEEPWLPGRRSGAHTRPYEAASLDSRAANVCAVHPNSVLSLGLGNAPHTVVT